MEQVTGRPENTAGEMAKVDAFCRWILQIKLDDDIIPRRKGIGKLPGFLSEAGGFQCEIIYRPFL